MTTTLPVSPPPQQRVIKVRRDYNAWVASESLEDYALRFTPRSFRKWSPWRVANTALGGAASFLVLEALGGTLLLQFGFVNTFWAILATALIIFAAGLPISVYAARHGLDMDLLTRGAGFGYIGSTVTSLIYASFTFIFFALEAAIMAYALELAWGIPPAWGYLVCALVVIPLVTHGVTAISQLQVWTQPLWLALLIVPYVYVFNAHPGLVGELVLYAGEAREKTGQGGSFDPLLFGGALTVGIALITQMGEQVDYLRFMPEKTAANRGRWWLAVLLGGPGWVLPGVLKMLGGALLAYLALTLAVPADRAVDPNQMYLAAYELVFPHYGWAVAATALLVIVSQLKINVTNAYAGSLAWSNFFARVTHSHPGRVVWVVFNTLIALMLMELEVFKALGGVLGLYSNIAISWIMAVVADLVVNKPLGLSPKGIEFKRAHLYDINPVGVGAMGAASVLSIAAYLGAFGPLAQPFSAVIAMALAFVAAPAIAWFTQGRYYIARRAEAPQGGSYLGSKALRRCVICERDYEGEDMAACPAYGGPICSLCCSLDARCHDLCKPEPARARVQLTAALRRLTPRAWWPQLDTGLGRYLLLMAFVAPALAGLLALLFQVELRPLDDAAAALVAPALRASFVKTYCALLLLSAVIGWWLVLTQGSRRVAQEESNRQTEALVREIDSHRRTDEELQRAKLAAEAARNSADAANQAKTRYISAVSHELRTPLNSILGYAQLLDEDPTLPPHRKQAVGVIRRGGEHLLGLIEGTLDIARIEGGKLALDPKPMRLREALQQIVQLFELQALAKGLKFEHDIAQAPLLVRADERRLTQILINVLGNAVKFTQAGRVSFRAAHVREMAVFEIEDTGPGIAPEDVERIFEPFSRGGQAAGQAASGGTGLGLTIAKMLTDLMGGEMTVSTQVADSSAPGSPGGGTVFRVRLFLPELQGVRAPQPLPVRGAYAGPRRRILVVDNEEVDRTLLARRLEALGFDVRQAGSGAAALGLLQEAAAAGDRGREGPADAILMDLAMPGIDGWQTIRTLRAQGLSAAPVAIVSANAFDKGADNDVGITAADFITKPVRFDELLDWLGARLQLQWLAAPLPAPPPPPAPDAPRPSRARLQALQDVIELGYPRGVQRLLDEIEAESPQCAAWLAPLRALAMAFQFDRMSPLIQDAIAKSEPAERTTGAGSLLQQARGAGLVLIVDDVPDNLAVLHDALDAAGYTVLVATDGASALQRAAQADPDIVLLDAVMPGMDGFEVARRLKAGPETAHIPIVFMTGLTDTEHVLAAFDAGGADYVTKPIRAPEVLARMAVHMGAARQARQARNALDAYGHATIALRLSGGAARLVWQTPLARRWLPGYFDAAPDEVPAELLRWLQAAVDAPDGREPRPLSTARGARQLVATLQGRTVDDDWLVVLREVSDAATVEATMQAFGLTLRESEVLYWVAKGKTNRDIGDILGSSPATVKKHLERIYEKLGVETRTAAAAMAMQRVRELNPA